MAPKKRGSGQAKRSQEAVDVVEGLAARLAQLGRRKWKVKDLEAALEKAAGALPDEGLRAHITDHLAECAAQLHERLRALQAAATEAQQQEQQEQQAQPQRQQRTKRSRQPAATAAAAAEADVTEAEMAEAEEELESLPLVETAAGYRQLAAGAAAGTPDPRFTSAALLLSRKLPAAELVLAHVQRLCPVPPPAEGGAGADADAAAALQRCQALVAAAGVALGVCAALACEADCPEDALCTFAPALGLLREAAQLLLHQLEQQEAGEAAEAASSIGSDPAAVLRELSQLASRALASMHAALRAQQLRLATGQPAGGSGYWRANPDQPSPAEAADAACAACSDVCLLLSTLRLHSSGLLAASSKQRQQQDALAAAAAADLRLLAPYGASGLLDYLATLPKEEAYGSSAAARQFLVLYAAAAKQELAGEREYLCRLAAARTAAAAARAMEQESAAAAITAEACALPTSQAFVGWLQEQPPSGIVSTALAAARGGLDALSTHLVQECSERSMAALLAAMQHGDAAGAAAGRAGAAAGAQAAEGGAAEAVDMAAPMDDLLFFADKQGDTTVFGRDWQMGSEDEEEEDEEGGDTGGLHLQDLPGSEEQEGDRRRSVSLGSE
ncbi:hypothetical protein C2E21_4752 [Chlorella sorokiniana]|uniref:Uncharacterized protein n=1 Tax=Chlorella sorokiniana TaxID=3076 RepID=A0A2P6TRN3_CHLSO|nr:hypothetical protein C2E21_4752 [Chlorella sorokiniana]|eukprot:PRW56714.1 hypothetical protein C2E21_4752 [Chlorella sorokiniana]